MLDTKPTSDNFLIETVGGSILISELIDKAGKYITPENLFATKKV